MDVSPNENEVRSFFHAAPLKDFYSVSEIVTEFTKQCARFRSPLTWRNKITLRIAAAAAQLSVFQNIAALPTYTVPPNWQVLLNYLYAQGIIEKPEFNTWLQPNDAPQQHKVLLRAANKPTLSNSRHINNRIRAYGISATIEEAYAKCIGEMLERYFLTIYKTSSFVRASYNSLRSKGARVLDIGTLPNFLPWQEELFPEYIRTPDSLFSWIKVKELISNSNVYVPAQLIFWGYKFNNEPVLRQATTSGGAGHYTFEESVLSAIYENVERDAFLVHWLNTISPPVLDIGSITDKDATNLIETLQQRYGFDIYILDITYDIAIPSCAVVLVDNRGDVPWMSVGASTGFTISKNIISAITEALSTQTAPEFPAVTLPHGYKPFTNKQFGKDARLALWKAEDMADKWKFFVSGETVSLETSPMGKAIRTFESIQAEYEQVLNLFREKGAGYQIYCHEVHHPVLQTLGYHVTKVVIPHLFPLYLNESYATLNSRSIQQTPNPWPHPFP